MRSKNFPNLTKPLSEERRQGLLEKAQLREKRERACDSKFGYFSERKALAVAQGRCSEEPSLKSLQVYKCPFCKFWHLTKRVQMDGGAILNQGGA